VSNDTAGASELRSIAAAGHAEGESWRAVPAGREWGLAPEGRTCRWRGSPEPSACGQPAAVYVMRGIKNRIAWHYCAAHAARHYQVWTEGLTVMTWRRDGG
jgi:hypothetical protein